ncbi:MAG: hypothetical protein OXC44_05490 [Proteobacteria bacterium]|nr:hypothetical protein [Pseudomonadota bacterium]
MSLSNFLATNFVSPQAMVWVFFALSTFILIAVPWLNRLSLRFEQQSRRLRYIINITLATLVIHHILVEAYGSSGVASFGYAALGFVTTLLIHHFSSKTQFRPWPVLPWAMALTIGLHGIFDGFAIRIATLPTSPEVLTAAAHVHDHGSSHYLSSILGHLGGLSSGFGALSLGLSVLVHRIPESLLIWHLTSQLVSKKAATITLITLGATTFLGVILSDEILHQLEPFHVNVAHLQVFIAGAILHTTLHKVKSKQDPCCAVA